MKKIQKVPGSQEEVSRLKKELHEARMDQLEAEADLAQEQAAVNAFRMHCRLKLDDLVEELMELQAQREAYLTRLALLQQGDDLTWLESDLPPVEEDLLEADDEDNELILPTPTPHDKEAEKRLYRELARRFHPDLARTAVEQSYRTEMMAAVNEAYAARNVQALYDLAGELEPGEMLVLTGIEDVNLRRLREQILNARRRRRKALHQLTLLRKDNTARLWHRARTMESQGQDWWSAIEHELEQIIERRHAEVDALKDQLKRLDRVV